LATHYNRKRKLYALVAFAAFITAILLLFAVTYRHADALEDWVERKFKSKTQG
jgi:hypothetical protein